MAITTLTRHAWQEWHEDHPSVPADKATCCVCKQEITIGKVAAYWPSVGNEPVELLCDVCVIPPGEEQ